MNKFFNLQFFADAGTLVNATGNYVNAGTGTTTVSSSIGIVSNRANSSPNALRER